VASSLYFSFANQYSLGGGFSFPIVLVPRYKLSLCHPPIKPDLLGFPGIGVFACWLRDHVITRFASFGIKSIKEDVVIGMIGFQGRKAEVCRIQPTKSGPPKLVLTMPTFTHNKICNALPYNNGCSSPL